VGREEGDDRPIDVKSCSGYSANVGERWGRWWGVKWVKGGMEVKGSVFPIY
jgi:hypothetical protein